MKVPLSWIKEFVPLTLSPEKIAETLTLAGIEVEGITSTASGFEGVVVGRVLGCEPHPNADRLRVATVTDGNEPFQVVCGAPNCRVGITVAFAKIGAKLTDESGKEFKIKKSKLRDVDSHGMLCSGKELGLSEEQQGILELDPSLELGSNVKDCVSDVIFEISLTPNLGHCWSIYGIARELAALLHLPLKRHKNSFPEQALACPFSVDVSAPQLAPRYLCRTLQGVKVGPSPEWLVSRLAACGIKSINNLIDAAHYITLAYGQPFHLFDADTLIGKKIVVTDKARGPALLTLDNQLREIPKGALVISDAKEDLAFAGILGGSKSSVNEATTNLLIEAASFSPIPIRKTAKQLGIRTDASARFERGVDRETIPFALDTLTELLQKLGGGIASRIIDIRSEQSHKKTIPCRTERVNHLLGTTLSSGEIHSLLERLEMKVHESRVEIPSYRADIHTEIDLVEEIARLYGFNNLPKNAPHFSSSTIAHAPIYLLEKRARSLLIAAGLQECITCDLIGPLERRACAIAPVSVLHPRSLDQSLLRTSLLPGLLLVVKRNLNRQHSDLHLFEVGRIHLSQKEGFAEPSMASILLSGNTTPHYHSPKVREQDFFDLKGIVENFLSGLHVPSPTFVRTHLPILHPGRQAAIHIEGSVVGTLGELHPGLLREFKIEPRVFFAELDLSELLPLQKKIEVKSLEQFPSSSRDLTLTVETTFPLASLLSLSGPYLESVSLHDLYTGEGVAEGKQNVTLRLTYRAHDRTISYEEVEAAHGQITSSLAKKLSS